MTLVTIGVVAREGAFEAGDAVELVGPDGAPFAKASSVRWLQPSHAARGVEAGHRDRLVLYRE